MVNTRFWDDGYTSNLDPIEKLLFLYFLTNTSTNICGIYEIPLKKIAVETGIDRDTVLRLIERFTRDHKISYLDGWVAIANFVKHQNQRSPLVLKGIETEMQRAPELLREWVEGKGIDTLSHLTQPNSMAEPAEKKSTTPNANAVIDLFEEINPAFALHYKRKTQRDAAQRLFAAHGVEKLTGIIGYIKAHQSQQYFPTISSPCDLEEKWSKLEAFAARQLKATPKVLW